MCRPHLSVATLPLQMELQRKGTASAAMDQSVRFFKNVKFEDWREPFWRMSAECQMGERSADDG